MYYQRILLCFCVFIGTFASKFSIAQDVDFNFSISEIVAIHSGVVTSRVVQIAAREDQTCEIMKNSVALGFRNKAVPGKNELTLNECVKELPESIAPAISGKKLKDAFYVVVPDDRAEGVSKSRFKYLFVFYGVQVPADSGCQLLVQHYRKLDPNAVCQSPAVSLTPD